MEEIGLLPTDEESLLPVSLVRAQLLPIEGTS